MQLLTREGKSEPPVIGSGLGEKSMEQRFIGIEELGQYLDIRPQTIRNHLSNGTFPIPAKKICGRVKFDKKDVERYVSKLKPHYHSREVDREQGF